MFHLICPSSSIKFQLVYLFFRSSEREGYMNAYTWNRCLILIHYFQTLLRKKETWKCLWQFFLFARLNLANVLISIAKKFFSTASFLSGVFMYQKRQISLPVVYKTARAKNRRLGTIVTSFQDFKLREKQISPTFSYFLINNALLYHFLANWLAQNKKMTEKSVFREAWSSEMTSQSFPVSCFWSRVLCPTGLLVHQNTGKENRDRKFVFAIHISTLRRFTRANKKNLSYTLSCFLFAKKRLEIHVMN